MWEVGTEINLFPCVQYGFHIINFHKTQNYSIHCCGQFLYWILSKLDEKIWEQFYL